MILSPEDNSSQFTVGMIFGKICQKDIHLWISIIIPRDYTRYQCTVIPKRNKHFKASSQAIMEKDTFIFVLHTNIFNVNFKITELILISFFFNFLSSFMYLSLFDLQNNSGWLQRQIWNISKESTVLCSYTS